MSQEAPIIALSSLNLTQAPKVSNPIIKQKGSLSNSGEKSVLGYCFNN